MANHSLLSPIIVVGMHRSGTSLLTNILQELGLFIGVQKDSNDESVFFQGINDWLLRSSGASWDYPLPVGLLFERTYLREISREYIESLMTSPRAVSFLGVSKYLRYRSISRMDVPWGWKDPRNTFTLPIWLEIFPNAKIIHVVRHGVDVANSLRTRQESETIRI